MKGIMFKEELFRAVVAGTKTETRRVVKHLSVNEYPDDCEVRWSGESDGNFGVTFMGREANPHDLGTFAKPRYQPGEVVYLKEPWYVHRDFDGCKPSGSADYAYSLVDIYEEYGDTSLGLHFLNDGQKREDGGRTRSPIHLPETFARYHIRITEVRCERLQEMGDEDAWAEGIPRPKEHYIISEALFDFGELWDSIAKVGSKWYNNPWVWVYCFELTEAP